MPKPKFVNVISRHEDGINDQTNELDMFLLALEATSTPYDMYDSYDDMRVPEDEKPAVEPFPTWDTVIVLPIEGERQYFFADGKFLGSGKLEYQDSLAVKSSN